LFKNASGWSCFLVGLVQKDSAMASRNNHEKLALAREKVFIFKLFD
jgi:hypothetical protein